MNAISKLTAAAMCLASTLALAAPCGGPNAPPCEIPEPGSLPLVLLGVGAAGVLAAVRYFKRK